MRRRLCASLPGLALCLLASAQARADDADALALADRTTTSAATASPWTVVVETSWLNAYGDAPRNGQRASLDVAWHHAIAPDWALAFSDRLDVLHDTRRHAVNTLREAYVDWRRGDAAIVDVGRVNQRIGAAFGYNPTDVFKSDAIRDAISQSPDSLRSDRLGTLMLRGQYLWADDAVTGIVAPRLARRSSDAPFSVDLGATNRDWRWLVMGNPRLAGAFSPQWIAFGTGGGAPHAGLNVTGGLGNATVVYAEWSGGREVSQFDAASRVAGPSPFTNKASAGLTYTTGFNLSLTLEYEFNQAALGPGRWRQLVASDPQGVGNYLDYSSAKQENAARHTVFAYASWSRFALDHAELRMFAKLAPEDHSRLVWGQFLYKFGNLDVGLERDLYHGPSLSAYAASPGLPRWQATLAYYF